MCFNSNRLISIHHQRDVREPGTADSVRTWTRTRRQQMDNLGDEQSHVAWLVLSSTFHVWALGQIAIWLVKGDTLSYQVTSFQILIFVYFIESPSSVCLSGVSFTTVYLSKLPGPAHSSSTLNTFVFHMLQDLHIDYRPTTFSVRNAGPFHSWLSETFACAS